MDCVARIVRTYRRLVVELFTAALTQSVSDVVRAQATMAEFVDCHFELRRHGLYVRNVVADAREHIIRNLAPELGDEKARFFADAPLELLRRAVLDVMDEIAEERPAVADARCVRVSSEKCASNLRR
jgi:hypothetical protein